MLKLNINIILALLFLLSPLVAEAGCNTKDKNCGGQPKFSNGSSAQTCSSVHHQNGVSKPCLNRANKQYFSVSRDDKDCFDVPGHKPDERTCNKRYINVQ
jgi:hypothetical protein